MTNAINLDRRRFFGIAAMTVAAVEFGAATLANAQTAAASPAKKVGGHQSFESLKQIKAGVVNIG